MLERLARTRVLRPWLPLLQELRLRGYIRTQREIDVLLRPPPEFRRGEPARQEEDATAVA